MELLLILLLVTSVPGIPQCNRIKIGEKFYEKEVLWANVGRPYNLNVYKSTNALFFSYSAPETYSDNDFQLAFYNIDTKEYQAVAGIVGGCAIAIDNASDDIYMGGSDGIYKFNMLTKIADFYKENGKNIWSLFFKSNLFYISYPDQRLHIEIDGKFSTVKEFENFEVDHFFVSNSNQVYFANKSGLYNFDTKVMKVKVINELITVRKIVEDNDYNLYICTNLGLLINSEHDGFRKIVDHKNIYGLTFDKDNNFIISDGNNIIRLKPSFEGCDTDDFHW